MEELSKPVFPHIALNIVANGVQITIWLGPATAINQFIDEQTMDQLAQGWRERRRALASQSAMSADIMRTKH
jgi:hypothetical protein